PEGGASGSAVAEPLPLVAFDFGIKRNILRLLVGCGFAPTVVPAGTSAEEALAMHPRGIFLSNGPGDPGAVAYAHATIRRLAEQGLPTLGICLGHQILAHAFGGRTVKMKFGHHGANHPVLELDGGRIDITSQNHSFAVDGASLEGTGLKVTHKNANDDCVEGLRHETLPVFSVQYHPEAAPGPHDARHLFLRFRKLVKKRGRVPAA
ncbi:MAG: carbamoyl phosphate synthase small subunit, partial [Planctomycetota bacterium]